MNEVQWIGGGQVTEEQMRFFLSSATHDMIEEELSQLKHHKVSQPTKHMTGRTVVLVMVALLRWHGWYLIVI